MEVQESFKMVRFLDLTVGVSGSLALEVSLEVFLEHTTGEARGHTTLGWEVIFEGAY